MRLQELNRIKKLYFGYEEIARVFNISLASAKVAASRYVRHGLLLRMKKNLYVRREVWNATGIEEKFLLANLGQVPSYISLMTALEYYEVTTQVLRDYFESVAIKRTKEINLDGCVFRYTKVARDLYFGFKKERNFFITTPEKALLDAFYLRNTRHSINIFFIVLSFLKYDHNVVLVTAALIASLPQHPCRPYSLPYPA
jgi:predicted transcriptional regulator of viral defense system